jgi:hypothetical protein
VHLACLGIAAAAAAAVVWRRRTMAKVNYLNNPALPPPSFSTILYKNVGRGNKVSDIAVFFSWLLLLLLHAARR